MRYILILLILFISCGTPKVANISMLQGTWIPVQQEMGGKQLPQSVYEKQRLVITDTLYTFTAESVDKGTLAVQDSTMDIYGKEGVNTGRKIPAKYRIEGNKLYICYNLSGSGYPEVWETKGKPMYFLSVFKRAE